MSDDVLIRVDGASKKFCRELMKSLRYGVHDIVGDLIGWDGTTTGLRPAEFWAVNDVSFELRRGECLGLIGRNGAGKTTLLKMLNGLIKPDRGRIEMRGRVGALIALGAGFNPVLSGRENIYVNGAILGLSRREIDSKLDDIIDFAEVGDFINAPVQSYSSGMQVRLGFAVATALQPDVLLLDEVLAVGDAAFRNKCYRRIAEFRKNAAVIFVSHNMDQIARTCTKGLVMASGAPILLGSVEDAVAAYDRVNVDTSDDDDAGFLSFHHPIEAFEATFGEERVASGAPLDLNLRVRAKEPLPRFMLRIFFYNAAGAFTAEANCQSERYGVELGAGSNDWSLKLQAVPLKQGRYRIAFNLIDPYGDLVVWSYKQHELVVTNTYSGAISECQMVLDSWRNAAPGAQGRALSETPTHVRNSVRS